MSERVVTTEMDWETLVRFADSDYDEEPEVGYTFSNYREFINPEDPYAA